MNAANANGLAESLRRLVNTQGPPVEVGVVTAVDPSDHFGYLLTVRLEPSQRVAQARPLWANGGATGDGVFWPVAVGDEVVVLAPGGDWNRAVALAGPTSGPNLPPASWENDALVLACSDGGVEVLGGLEVRDVAADTVKAVQIAETFLPDLSGFMTTLDTFLLTCAAATTAAQVAAAAGVFLGSPAYTTFKSRVAAGTLYTSTALKAK
jgi:phage baseplate assembly protein gpV